MTHLPWQLLEDAEKKQYMVKFDFRNVSVMTIMETVGNKNLFFPNLCSTASDVHFLKLFIFQCFRLREEESMCGMDYGV